MKPRIQCVLTQSIPGSTASGSTPIVMISIDLEQHERGIPVV